MITMKDKTEIIQLKEQGISNREVSRRLGTHRKTVAKYWNEHNQLLKQIDNETDSKKIKEIQNKITAAPKYDSSSRKAKVLTEKFYDDLKLILDSEIEKEKLLKTKKQNLTKLQIYSLMKQAGHKAGYSTVCAAIDKYRNLHKECYIKQHYYYGERLEYDFGEVHLWIDNSPYTLYLAVLSAPASNLRWAFLYDNQKQSVFLDSHVRFFQLTNGVWKEVVYDNMRNVVKKFLGKNEKELNDELLKLATYYGFKINVTNAYRGNEKGHVENSVKTLRNQIFAEKYKFKNVEEAELYMNKRLLEINSKNLDKINAELSVLEPAPVKYEIAKITTSRVDKCAMIQVECNKYSVPEYLVGYKVTTKIYHDKIIIYSNDEYVCKHKKLKGKGGYSVDIRHYLKTLLKKPGAIYRSVALRSNPQLNEIYIKYYLNDPSKFISIINYHKKSTWDVIFDQLITYAKWKSFNKNTMELVEKIPVPNNLDIQTAKMVAQYNNLVIGGI